MNKSSNTNLLSKNAEYKSLFKENLKEFVKNLKREDHNKKYFDKPYTAFFPMIGRDYKIGENVLIIGRVPNRWGNEDEECNPVCTVNKLIPYERWLCKSMNNSKPEDDSCQNNSEGNNCSLDWLWTEIETDKGRRKKVINSAFWNYTGEILKKASSSYNNRWTRKIAWSNLMKIAPAEGWNPNLKECEWQLNSSKKLFYKELEILKPKYVLMITNHWADKFIKKEDEKTKNKYVRDVKPLMSSTVIVTIRPESKKKNKFVDNIFKFLR